MKLANLIAAGAALTAGLAGGTATYLVAAQPTPSSEAPPVRTTEVSATSPAPTVAPSKPIVKLAPCKPPAVREGKACVTDLVETVVLPAPSSGTAGAPASGGFHPTGHDDSDDDGDDNGSEATGHAENEADDHAGDHEADDQDHADDDDSYDDEDADHADEDEDHADEDHADEDEGQDD